jgi:phosphoribosylamine--glycine ligase
VLFAGLMVDGEQPYLIEFNARFGDPETQVGLELLETDLLAAMEAVVDDRIADCPLEFSKDAAVCVVLAAQGYPGVYAKGDVIRGLDQVQRSYVLQAGTAKDERGQLVTHGGRVLNVVARGDSLTQARTFAYQAVDEIDFAGKVYRTDIGDRFGNLH